MKLPSFETQNVTPRLNLAVAVDEERGLKALGKLPLALECLDQLLTRGDLGQEALVRRDPAIAVAPVAVLNDARHHGAIVVGGALVAVAHEAHGRLPERLVHLIHVGNPTMELRVCDVEVGQDRGAVGSDRLPLRMPIGLAGIAVADVLVPGVVELAIVCGDITR